METWELAGGTAGGGIVVILLHRLLTVAETYLKKRNGGDGEVRNNLVVLAEISKELTKVATILENIHEDQQKISDDVVEIKATQDKQIAIERDRMIRAG